MYTKFLGSGSRIQNTEYCIQNTKFRILYTPRDPPACGPPGFSSRTQLRSSMQLATRRREVGEGPRHGDAGYGTQYIVYCIHDLEKYGTYCIHHTVYCIHATGVDLDPGRIPHPGKVRHDPHPGDRQFFCRSHTKKNRQFLVGLLLSPNGLSKWFMLTHTSNKDFFFDEYIIKSLVFFYEVVDTTYISI